MATEVKLPEVGEGIESGTVVGVLVKVGDQVGKDQALIELETDKAVVEVPSTVAGVVKQINVKENDQAAIGSVLVVMEEGVSAAATGESAGSGAQQAAVSPSAAQSAPAQAAPAAQAQEPAATPATTPATTPAATPPAPRSPASSGGAAATADDHADLDRLVPAAPSVRRLARELGVDIHHVGGTGVLGRVSAADVRGAASTVGGAGTASGAPAGRSVVAPTPLPDFSRYGATTRSAMNGVRKATLKAMTNAWGTVPMVTHFDKADITELERLRKRYQPQAEAAGAKLTPTAILLKVVAIALKRFPDFNASIDTEKLEIVHKQYVNVGVAVDTDAGLLVPVVKAVDTKNMIELAVELGELAAKARDRKLSIDEMQGGNFSISNLGGIGGTGFTPIVNPPDVAILGVSRASVEPVWNKDSATFEPRTMMPLALTYDHRLIDGAAAARFLRWICSALEDPFVVALEA
ncbi:MAG TPA: 2-oxo acid dehydrogenase subunit E2 [Trueperaceae bacterium]|nr:2-oxo acid dehydrogenase subunit E2 [Trueperaceae bacterium]